MVLFIKGMTSKCIGNIRTAKFDIFPTRFIKTITTTNGLKIIDNGKALIIPFQEYVNNINNNKITESRFDAAWLWSNCPSKIHSTSGQRNRTPGDYNGMKIINATLVTNDNMEDKYKTSPYGCCHPINTSYKTNLKTSKDWIARIEWSDNELSYYNINYLKRWRYDDSSLQSRKHRTEITTKQAITSDSQLFTIDYASIISNKASLYKLLQSIFQNGAAIVDNTPTDNYDFEDEASITQLANALSGMSHGSLYGDLFQVKSSPNPNNIAYTSYALPPHQDLAYYESIPGLQLLHCIHNDCDGGLSSSGESTLIDCMAAASFMRDVEPYYFDILTRVPATFVKQRDGVCMTYRRPHIILSEGEIVGVNWSPPFEGRFERYILFFEFFTSVCCIYRSIKYTIILHRTIL